MTTVAVGIAAMAAAMGLLGLSLKSFGGMSWEEIGKGMSGSRWFTEYPRDRYVCYDWSGGWCDSVSYYCRSYRDTNTSIIVIITYESNGYWCRITRYGWLVYGFRTVAGLVLGPVWFRS